MAPRETYVHPRHGICHVLGRQERHIGDATRVYVELQVNASPSGRAALTMLLPEDELMEHVRPVVSKAAARKAMAALEDRVPSPVANASSWRARVAKTESTIDEGDLVTLARVLRDLAAHDAKAGLSSSERRVADQVRDLVVGEIAGSLGSEIEDVAADIDERLAAQPEF